MDSTEKYLENCRKGVSGLVRELLVKAPVNEEEIVKGDCILYAEPRQGGQISFEVMKVGGVIEGELPGGHRVFEGLLPNGDAGKYEGNFDSGLDLLSMYELSAGYGPERWNVICNESAATGDNCAAKYKDGTLELTWEGNRELMDAVARGGDVKVAGKWVCESWMRYALSPGVNLRHDIDTEEIEVSPTGYRAVQRIPNGPLGSFTLPKYQKLDEEDYLYLSDKIAWWE